jgi:NitT/TauT family transport system substrate-binding protein
VKVVAVADNGSNNGVIVGPDINFIQDLRGKTVGLQAGIQYELTVEGMLRSANMDAGDVTIVPVNPEDALVSIKNGQIQATALIEPYFSNALSQGFKVIYPQKQLHLFPNLVVFRKSVISERPEDVRAFLKAWFEAADYRLQNPDETQAIAAKYLGLKAEDIKPDQDLKIFTGEDNKLLFNIQKQGSIYTITKITSDYLVSSGISSEQLDSLELLDPSYLP